MRPADTWVDYELIDATNHNRLERWGKTLLIRPDPQIIWKNEEVSPLWARADAIYYRSAKGGGQWDYHKKLPQKWNIKWQDLTLIVSPTGFKHTGVFPEQAVNWAWYQEKIKAADRPVKVLNLFGYTGGATLACLAAGASVTHVDASKGMVAWARENHHGKWAAGYKDNDFALTDAGAGGGRALGIGCRGEKVELVLLEERGKIGAV